MASAVPKPTPPLAPPNGTFAPAVSSSSPFVIVILLFVVILILVLLASEQRELATLHKEARVRRVALSAQGLA